ncbi:type IV secretory system conjugative DNA transfer family protein [Rhizobium sp. PP-CC-3G-465]|uniref:type IV secretory system conjugative DNA transfer family protein n=1 Tax=Rhizobium sp. PP-CC-3G-465 TaxID=2135648 RepID=UPI001051DC94|nr:type IV secretion system protein VirD4 [Rhizobium sp. PP-CC-3G-465]
MEVLGLAAVLAALFIGAVMYSSSGGVGGAVARSRVRPPTPPLPAVKPGATLADIEAFHTNELNVVQLTVAELTPDLITNASFYRLGRTIADKHAHLDRRANGDDHILKAAGSIEREFLHTSAELALKGAAFQRTLRDMTEAERATLRLADLLACAGQIDRRERLAIFAPIVWNQGKGLMVSAGPFRSADLLGELRATLTTLIEGHLGPSGAATERLQQALRDALGAGSRLTTSERTVLQRLLVTGAKWMAQEEAATALVYKSPPRPSVLRLGQIEGSESELLYDRNESLITFGPPGQGKSQSATRNLLTMDGGALVIDIKGELFEQTAVWRARNVGPVYRFAPADPANSIHYNPLDTIRPQLADAYEDAMKLVDLLMVPNEAAKRDYWDKRGLSLLADAILDTALFGEGEYRTMSAIFDRLYLNPLGPDGSESLVGSELDQWLNHLSASKVKKLVRTATAIRSMPYKVRESVTETARTHIDTWQSPRIEELTMRSTFDPLSLRRDKATLYICITLDELAQYTSFFRALIGQAFYALCRGEADRDTPVVTFFLDEMPALHRLDILETALDMGRGHGVRLWMFAQNFGQLAKYYKNPSGFLENSYVRQFMGISGDQALKLSKQLDERHGLIDGKRKPLVFPHELTGDPFRDLTLTISQGHSPARVVKAYGYAEYGDRIESAKELDCRDGLLKLPVPKAGPSSGQTRPA